MKIWSEPHPSTKLRVLALTKLGMLALTELGMLAVFETAAWSGMGE